MCLSKKLFNVLWCYFLENSTIPWASYLLDKINSIFNFNLNYLNREKLGVIG